MSVLRKIDRSIRDLLLFMLDILKFVPAVLIKPGANISQDSYNKNEVLLIKTDEIGDYLLFRDYLSFIRNSDKFKNYKIILCGNKIWKDIALNFDKSFIDEFVWIDKTSFNKNLLYRVNFLKSISRQNPETVINCSYSRNFFIDDSIIESTRAKYKIGFKTDLSNSYKWQVKLSDKYYTKLIDCSEERFELNKNRFFYENILGTKIQINKPAIYIPAGAKSGHCFKDYVVLFLGGKRKYKKWDMNKFLDIGNYVISKYNFNILLVGAKSEINDNRRFYKSINRNDKVTDLTGKTSLSELLLLLESANLLISNDSGIIHMAASVNTCTIVLLNGSQFGRFLPYPEDSGANITTFYPDEIKQNLSDKEYLYKKYEYRSLLDINSISPEEVKVKIDKIVG